MPVVVKYVVERNGCEKMTYTNKAEADAYDKLLDTADALSDLLSSGDIIQSPSQIDEIAMFLAKNKDDVLVALGNKRKKAKTVVDPEQTKDHTSSDLLDELIIEPDDESSYDESDIAEIDVEDSAQYDEVEGYIDNDAA